MNDESLPIDEDEEEETIPSDTAAIQRVSAQETQFTLTPNGLIYWPLPLDAEIADYVEPQNETGYVQPGETVKLARAILAREAEYAHRQQELDEEYISLAHVVIDKLGSQASELAASGAEWSTVRWHVYHAYTALAVAEEENPLTRWYKPSFLTDEYSHGQLEGILFQYIKTVFYQRYPQE
jgi:hypothetical protein